jgi:electron transfer flavoprotein alpha subunit
MKNKQLVCLTPIPTAACLGSKYIVAINKDKEANIFSVAHFVIVGDYKEVLPALTAKLKELKSK